MNATARRSGWPSWSLSILLHLLVVAVVTGIWFWQRAPHPTEQRLAIEASVVTSIPARQASPPSAQPEVAPIEVPEPEPAPEPAPAPAPEVDVAQIAAEQAAREAEAERIAAEEHVAEQRRVAEAKLAAERKAEQAAKEKAEREKKAREKAEREKAEREKVERDKAELERKQREALAEQARLQRESGLTAQIAEEERVAAVRAGAAGRQYIAQIAARIERAWTRPPGATPGTQCEVHVTQVRGGVVTAVQVVRCNRDETVRQSIEDAVYRASPLPQPSDPALFDRNLTITFRPEN